MKASIVIWAYIGLGYILLSNILDIVIYLFQMPDTFPLISSVVFAAATIAIFGLMKRTSWARMIAFSVVVVEVLLMLGMSIYFQRVMPEMGINFLTSSLVFDVPLLFLAYKIYSSEALKIYLSKQE
ncbi:MAG: hypothetical protein KZQ99_15300 [Candidatus Thiodiazotropha sp. (ex Dulcina madagascariensis)]|nr:hypothetical protein [Candidatus Thiodiazotropha sp. (ex Dulcina madagascariensis)]